MNLKSVPGLLAGLLLALSACKHPIPEPRLAESGYPEAVRNIIVTKCATAGCHNNQSRAGADGLSMETWDKLFEGSNTGAVVIPYRPDFSPLMYFINTDSSRGPALQPTMPYNGAPLSDAEYQTLKDWITAGAPNKDGFVKFSDNPQRKKFYVGNQGCDVAFVFDAASMLAMRVVNVGHDPGPGESPHMIRVAPNNEFYCVCFVKGAYFQKFSTADNRLLGEVYLGDGSWNTFVVTPDSKTAYTTDLSLGKLAIIDLEAMTAKVLSAGLVQPHGTALNETGDTLYITGQVGNFLYKYSTDLLSQKIITVNGGPQSFAPSYDLHDIIFSPDRSKYFVTCQTANEVRVLDRGTNALIKAIPVGNMPQEFGISQTYPYLFVSCMEDTATFPGGHGSIYVINYNTLEIVKKLDPGYQPHGVVVDDGNNRVYISNRNVNPNGPAPHHTTVCGGRDGYITAINLQTLELVPGFKAEVSSDPYGMGISH